MLRITNDLTANKLIFANSINWVDGGKVIVETNSKESGMGFHISGARLAFAEKKQAYSTTLILHDYNPVCHNQIQTDVSDHAIGRCFS